VSRRWILALIIAWIAGRLLWYIPWLLGVEQPSPAALALIMGVLDVLVLIVIVTHIFRSAVSGASNGDE
jgi:xanthosine utilization system XapX-like protein